MLLKPISLAQITELFSGAVPAHSSDGKLADSPRKAGAGASTFLPIDEARRIRSGRESKVLTQAESEAAICEAISGFYHDYLGWQSEGFRADLFKDLVVVRIQGAMPPAEQELGKSTLPQNGRDLAKNMRNQLLELARPMLESLIYEIVGVKALGMLHDTQYATGEEVIVFSLASSPRVA